MADFEWYRSFLAVYRNGTVSGAAQERFLTQPAITQHLAALETTVGKPLFTRTPRKMLPTESGKQLYNEIAASLDQLEQVTQQLGGLEEAKTIWRLGAPHDFFHALIAPKMGQEAIYLQVRFDTTERLVEALTRRELDLVIATQKQSNTGLEFSHLRTEEFRLVAPPGYELPPASGELEKWLSRQPWLSYGADLPIVRRFWQLNFGRRPNFNPALVVPSLLSIHEIVQNGYGIALLPDYLCDTAIEAGKLQLLWQPPEKVSNDIWWAYRRSDHHNPLIARWQNLLT
jgi:DNA-binding transcriptional LysR family regulator